MSRVPFAPRLAAASVCRLAVGAAALVLAIPIERALHGISFQYRYVETTDVAISATLAMLTLGFFATREPRSVKEGSTVWIVGGGASGIAAALGVCALVSCRLQHLRGSLLDLLLGAAGGVLFGMLCSLPARELRAARSDQTHSAQDVQIVNTCAWLCGVVGVSAHFAESVEWLYLAAGIATCALGAMLLATARYVLHAALAAACLRGRGRAVGNGRHEHHRQRAARPGAAPVVERRAHPGARAPRHRRRLSHGHAPHGRRPRDPVDADLSEAHDVTVASSSPDSE